MRWIAAFCSIALLGPARAVAADWVRIDTPNFVVYGEAGEKRVREVAGQFERFREALGRVVPAADTRAAVPTVVVVFETHKSFGPYRPMFNGKHIEEAGYFRGSDLENVVALTVEGRADALRVIFHEYTHLAVSNVTPNLPPWVSEGLADFYSTFLVSQDGRRATLGMPIRSHLQLLRTTALMPMTELLSVTHDSPLYNEGQRRALFYAQSWALVHYLMLEEPTRGANLWRYVRLVSEGTDPVAAWTEVFGTADIVPAIQNYAGREQVRGLVYSFSARIDPASGVVAHVAPSEMAAVFGDLLQWTAAPSLEAEAQLDRAAAMQPSSARAQALIGLTRARRSDGGDPLAPLLAASRDPDWLTQYYVAAGLARRVDSVGEGQRPEVIAAATRALDEVEAARPGLPHVLMLRAYLALRSNGDLAGALQNVRRARASAPGRDDYTLLEAQILARQNAFAEARNVLGPLLSRGATPEVRGLARTLMEQVVILERQAAERAERAATAPRDVLDSAPPPPAAPVDMPAYRIMRAGEQRTEGLLERLDCATHAVTLQVRADGHLLRFTAPSLAALAFITYRDDVSGAVGCGARVPPDRVFVTWTPAKGMPSNVVGRAVVVEFLPK